MTSADQGSEQTAVNKEHADVLRGLVTETMPCAITALQAAIALLDPEPVVGETRDPHPIGYGDAGTYSGTVVPGEMYAGDTDDDWYGTKLLAAPTMAEVAAAFKELSAQTREQVNGDVKAVFAKEFQAELLERTLECDRLALANHALAADGAAARAKLAAIELECANTGDTLGDTGDHFNGDRAPCVTVANLRRILGGEP